MELKAYLDHNPNENGSKSRR